MTLQNTTGLCVLFSGLCYVKFTSIKTRRAGIESTIKKTDQHGGRLSGQTEELGSPVSYTKHRGLQTPLSQPDSGYGYGYGGRCGEAAQRWHPCRSASVWGDPQMPSAPSGNGKGLLNYVSKLDSRGASLPVKHQTAGFKSSLHHPLVLWAECSPPHVHQVSWGQGQDMWPQGHGAN